MKILGLVIIWLVIFGLAFVAPRLIEPTGSGFTRGLNRLPAFFGMHCLSFILAIGTAIFTFRTRSDLTKFLLISGFTPLAINLLFVVVVVGIYLAAMVDAMLR